MSKRAIDPLERLIEIAAALRKARAEAAKINRGREVVPSTPKPLITRVGDNAHD